MCLAFIICDSLASATPSLQESSGEILRARAHIASISRDKIEACSWDVAPLSLPLHAPHDLVAKALYNPVLPHLSLFNAYARRAEVVPRAPNDIDSSRIWRWGARLDLNNPRERLTRDQSLRDHVTALYAICEWSDPPRGPDAPYDSLELEKGYVEDQRLTFRSSHPFQVWVNGRLMGHAKGERSMVESRPAPHRSPLSWVFSLMSQPRRSSSARRSTSTQKPRVSQLLLRFEAHRGEVVWMISRSTDELRPALLTQDQRQMNEHRERHQVKEASKKSGDLREPEASQQVHMKTSKSSSRDVDDGPVLIAPLLKPLRPLVSSRELSQLIARAQWTQPRRVQLTAEVGLVERSGSSRDPSHLLHSPRRFTQQDQLYYIPGSWVNHKPLRSGRTSTDASEPLEPETLSASQPPAWVLWERSQMKRGVDQIYFTVRHLEAPSGHWILISARCLWRRPIWSEEWEDIPWTPLPSRVLVTSAVSDVNHWRASGWVRSSEPLSRSGLAWINALSPHQHSMSSVIARDRPRGAWLRWSAFNHWREVTALYKRGVRLEMAASHQRSQLDPTALSPKWLNAYRAPQRLIHEPLNVRWRFSDPVAERRLLNQAPLHLTMSAWIDEFKRLMIPQTSTPALPVGIPDDFAPGRFALTLAEREDAQLIVWSPPDPHPLFDQPRALDHWGIRLTRVGQDSEVTQLQALNGQPIPAGSPWILIGSPRDHSSLQSRRSAKLFNAQSVERPPSPILRLDASQGDRSARDHRTHLMRVAPHTARVTEVELRLNFSALSAASKQVRAVWKIKPMISLDELWGDEVKSPSAIPDQLNALWRAPHRWTLRPRWWRGLPDRGTQHMIEDWSAWWRKRAELRGLKDLRAHVSYSDHHSAARAPSSGAQSHSRASSSELRGWWMAHPDRVWVPQLQLRQILKRISRFTQSKSISLRRVIQIDQALVYRRCSENPTKTHRILHPLVSYHSTWEDKDRQGREDSRPDVALTQSGQQRLIWTTTLTILGEITSAREQRQHLDLTQVIDQIERVESTHCLTSTLPLSHR